MKMEVFKQRIPNGYSAEIDNGEIVYYPMNAEKKCVENVRWVPEVGEEYWCMTDGFKVAYEKCHEGIFCKRRLESFNCFKIQEECEKYAEYMRECSLNYKPE